MALIKLLSIPRPAQEGYFVSDAVQLQSDSAKITVEYDASHETATDAMIELYESIDNDKYSLVQNSTRLIDISKNNFMIDFKGKSGQYLKVCFIQASSSALVINEINAQV